jgi:2-polyprenyl-3-methyl-5-hydroxy-6-metoxy-1,4-benzoquinol methylase
MANLNELRKTFRDIIFPKKEIVHLLSDKTFDNVLDIGAGTGFFLEVIRDHKIARSGYGVEVNSTYFRALDENFKIGPESEVTGPYDLVVFNDVLHHVKDKTSFLKRYLDPSHLKPTTMVLIKDMRPENKLFKYFNRLHDLVFAGESISEISQDEVESILADRFNVCGKGRSRIFLYDHYYTLFKCKDS